MSNNDISSLFKNPFKGTKVNLIPRRKKTKKSKKKQIIRKMQKGTNEK